MQLVWDRAYVVRLATMETPFSSYFLSSKTEAHLEAPILSILSPRGRVHPDSIYLTTIYISSLPICLSISIHPSTMSIDRSICRPTNPSIHPSTHPFIHPSVHTSVTNGTISLDASVLLASSERRNRSAALFCPRRSISRRSECPR